MNWRLTLDDLPHFASQFWQEAGTASVFAFHGPMGAGKTTTIAALCQSKGIVETPASPTFSIINEYSYEERGQWHSLYHIDLYRLKDENDIASTGAEDCVYSGELCFVEWPEKAPYLFDGAALHVVIQPLSATERQVQLLTATEFAAFSLQEQL